MKQESSPGKNQFSVGFVVLLTSLSATYFGVLNLMLPAERVGQALILFALFGSLSFFLAGSSLSFPSDVRKSVGLRTRLIVGLLGGIFASIIIEAMQINWR